MKGNIKTGSLYIVLIMFVLIVMGAELTQGLIPSNLPNNDGQIVKPILNTPDSNKNNLQLYTFDFITATPSPAPANTTCSENDLKPSSCNICPSFEAVACEPPRPCESGAIILDLPVNDALNTEYCVYVKNNDEARYNQKLTESNCRAACVSRRN